MQGKERDVRIKDGFVLRDVAGQTVVIATGEASRDFHGMVKLNGTGRVIWEGLSRGDDAEDIAQELVKSYDVDRSVRPSNWPPAGSWRFSSAPSHGTTAISPAASAEA